MGVMGFMGLTYRGLQGLEWLYRVHKILTACLGCFLGVLLVAVRLQGPRAGTPKLDVALRLRPSDDGDFWKFGPGGIIHNVYKMYYDA